MYVSPELCNTTRDPWYVQRETDQCKCNRTGACVWECQRVVCKCRVTHDRSLNRRPHKHGVRPVHLANTQLSVETHILHGGYYVRKNAISEM